MTPEIVERVSAWLRARPSASPLAASLVAAFVNEALCCFEERTRSNEYSQAIASAHEAAAMGCLLALVREAWGDPNAFANRMTGPKVFWRTHVREQCGTRYGHDGDSEAEALVAALESAP